MPFRIGFAKRHSYAGPGDTISLPVVLRSGQETISLVANLDTGAAYCLFERSYAEAWVLTLNVEFQ